jgi:uncharacterized integral membrane protein
VRLVHWFVTAPVTAVLVVFAVANRQGVAVWPLPDTMQVPLAFVVLFSLVVGFLIGELVAWLGGRRWRREVRHKARRIEALEHELAATQARLKPEANAGAPARISATAHH